MHFSELIAWADDSSLHLLLAAAVSVVLALLVHRIGSAIVLRLTRAMPVPVSYTHLTLPTNREV